VPAPVASLTTTLAPLFIMLLSAAFLAERPTVETVAGFVVAAAGMWLITTARRAGAEAPYAWAVLITAGAPLSWACYSVLSKPVAGRVSPVIWSYLATGIGGLLVAPFLPGRVWREWAALGGGEWLALEYLTLPCTVLGFALWTWLLRHLPASAVGLMVFLNPPLTTLSKAVLARLAPATFTFSITGREWLGGAVVLAGLAIGLGRRLAARSP
jgi:drug/metabolite transporter (DMT)-like permease